MILYYVVKTGGNIIPCYLLKEGYIPKEAFFEDKNHPYYVVGQREDYCFDSYNIHSVFENIFDAKQLALDIVKKTYNDTIALAKRDYEEQVIIINNFKAQDGIK